VALGGYYAGRAAAFETRVTAACSIGGPFDFGAAWDDLPTLSREAFAFFSGATDADEARRKASELRLEAVAHLIRCPLLVIFGRMDRLIPYQQAEAMAASVSNSTLVMFEEGNHVCNNIPYKYRPLAGDWMADRLNAGPG
jgi:2,6-dihydroxypseudooxynicotine hydrolase